MMKFWNCCSGICRRSQPVNWEGIAERCGDYKLVDSCEVFLQQHSLVNGLRGDSWLQVTAIGIKKIEIFQVIERK